jgi:hypothetical protein
VDANGRVSVADWIRIRNLSGSTLPAGEPGASPSPAASAVVRSGAPTESPNLTRRVSASSIDRVLSAQASRRVHPGGIAQPVAATESTPSTPLRASRQRRDSADSAAARDAIFSNL